MRLRKISTGMWFSILFLLFGLCGMAGAAEEEVEKLPNWLRSHWAFPIAPQGKAPEKFSELEISLMPEDCGQCHTETHEEWKTSRHALAMGHGVMGQLHSPYMGKEDVISCQQCHAPLYEQNPYLYSLGEVVDNRLYIDKLRHTGVSCAACHVRKRAVYGPVRQGWLDPDLPHNGFQVLQDFNRSEFCRPCHQFSENGRRINGKLLEDTYEQWKKSSYFQENVSCAKCHMPERKHLFRGIHSQRMVKDGMTIKLAKEVDSATLVITNTGTGHKLPTYATPKISIVGKVVTPDGVIISGTTIEKTIQWKLSLDLRKEYFDTRLNPGESFTLKFDFPKEHLGNIYEIEVRVYPDDFYKRFYEALLENPPQGLEVDRIRKALKDASNSDFSIYNRKFPF